MTINPVLFAALERGAIDHPRNPELDFAATEGRIERLTRKVRAESRESFVSSLLRLLHLDKAA